jgi:hypothetical protein
MKYTCPKCKKVIAKDYFSNEVMQEILDHEATHK